MRAPLACLAAFFFIPAIHSYTFSVKTKPGSECNAPPDYLCRCFDTNPTGIGTEIRASIDGISYYFLPGQCGRFSRNTSMIATVSVLQNDGKWSASLNMSLAQTYAYSALGFAVDPPYVVVAAVFEACINPYTVTMAPQSDSCPPRKSTLQPNLNLWSSSDETAMDAELASYGLAYSKTYSLSGWSFKTTAKPIVVQNEDGSETRIARFIAFVTSTRSSARTPLQRYLTQLTACGSQIAIASQSAPLQPFVISDSQVRWRHCTAASHITYVTHENCFSGAQGVTSDDPAVQEASVYDIGPLGGRVAQMIPSQYGAPYCVNGSSVTPNCLTSYAPSFEFVLATPSDGALQGAFSRREANVFFSSSRRSIHIPKQVRRSSTLRIRASARSYTRGSPTISTRSTTHPLRYTGRSWVSRRPSTSTTTCTGRAAAGLRRAWEPPRRA